MQQDLHSSSAAAGATTAVSRPAVPRGSDEGRSAALWRRARPGVPSRRPDAADAVNAAGGIKSLGGARIELILATPRRSRRRAAEAERLINAGAQISWAPSTRATRRPWSPCQQAVSISRDISAADPITANVAKRCGRAAEGPVRLPKLPTGTLFGQRAVQTSRRSSRRRRSAQARGGHARTTSSARTRSGLPGRAQGRESVVGVVESSRGPSRGLILDGGFARQAAKPTSLPHHRRPAPSFSCRRSPNSVSTSWHRGPGSPGLYEAGQIAALKENSST